MNSNTKMESKVVNPHISVDCVLIGFDGKQLCALLVRQAGKGDSNKLNSYKLPGSLIYEDEDLDESAKRVLSELTGLKSVPMVQFRAFGSKDRTNDPKDVLWLEEYHHLGEHIQRIVTIAYVALLKIDRRLSNLSNQFEAKWTPIREIEELAFDHKQIVQEALEYIRQYTVFKPATLFSLLPRKFTLSQLRRLYEVVYDMPIDARNFHKKIMHMNYVVALNEFEQGVAHRSAQFYRFDRVIYNQRNQKIN